MSCIVEVAHGRVEVGARVYRFRMALHHVLHKHSSHFLSLSLSRSLSLSSPSSDPRQTITPQHTFTFILSISFASVQSPAIFSRSYHHHYPHTHLHPHPRHCLIAGDSSSTGAGKEERLQAISNRLRRRRSRPSPPSAPLHRRPFFTTITTVVVLAIPARLHRASCNSVRGTLLSCTSSPLVCFACLKRALSPKRRLNFYFAVSPFLFRRLFVVGCVYSSTTL